MKKYKLIRVTSVLSFVESAWKERWWRKIGFEEADKISKESAEFGTKVHSFVDASLTVELGGIIEIDRVNSAMVQCGSKIIKYLESNKITPWFKTNKDSLEVEVKDTKLGLIGHFDYLANINGEPVMIDFKTSNKMRKSFPLQTAAYAKMANEMFSINITKGIIIRSHWNKDKQEVEFEVKEYNNLVKKYWPKFKMCLAIWKYFNRADNEI